MRSALFVLALTISAAPVGYPQDTSTQEAGQYHFRWSARKAQHLDDHATLRKSTALSPEDKRALAHAISALIRPFKAELHFASERELKQVVANTRIRLVDLNRDGVAEVLAHASDYRAGCGATGNCPFWVFRKSANGFEKILDTRGNDGIGGVEEFTVKEDTTNGFRDLVLGTHDSGNERTLLVYRLRGDRYTVAECYKANWLSTEGGQFRELKLPAITTCPSN